MKIPEMFTRNWNIKLVAFIIAVLIWYFIVGTI